MGNYYYTESNFRFIRDSKTGLLVFRLTCVAAIFIGAQMSFSMVWDPADVLMGLMALVNLVAILLLGGKAIRVLRDYQKQRRAGKNPSTATTRWAWAARRSGTKPTPKSGRTEPNPSLAELKGAPYGLFPDK